jgi:hypothetical protein
MRTPTFIQIEPRREPLGHAVLVNGMRFVHRRHARAAGDRGDDERPPAALHRGFLLGAAARACGERWDLPRKGFSNQWSAKGSPLKGATSA